MNEREKNLIKKENAIDEKNRLLELIKNGKLEKFEIIESSQKMDISNLTLCSVLLGQTLSYNEFLEYSKQFKKEGILSEDEMIELILSFFKTIQEPRKEADLYSEQLQEPEPIKDELTLDQQQEIAEKEKNDQLEALRNSADEIWEEQKTNPQNDVRENIEAMEPASEEIIQEGEQERKMEKRNWWEVERKTEVMAVEDLDGSFENFEFLMEKLNVAEKDERSSLYWKWKGGNKKLVFLGDILGDRNMNGMNMSQIIQDLDNQAIQEGGSVEQLCGNHDVVFIKFLCHSMNKQVSSDEALGVWELAKYDSDSQLNEIGSRLANEELELKPDGKFAKMYRKRESELWKKLYENMPAIIENLKIDPIGSYIIDAICNIKVLTIHDDTLFCHTDPTKEMIDDLISRKDVIERVAEINAIFQERIRTAIFNGEELGGEFDKIANLYLNTNNRKNFTENQDDERRLGQIEKIRKSGINAIVHGHSRSRSIFDDGSFIIASPHANEDGVMTIEKNGIMTFPTRSLRKTHN